MKNGASDKKSSHDAIFLLRPPAPGRKHRLTEADGTRKRGSEGSEAKAKIFATRYRRQGGGYAESFSVLFVLCPRSLTLMDEKGYAGGLGASAS